MKETLDGSKFIGVKLAVAFNDLLNLALEHDLYLNIVAPGDNPAVDDEDPARLNIIIDRNGFITGVVAG